MQPITNIKSVGKVGSCVFNYSDIELMNLYRRAILSEIETYAIEYVCFDDNTSSLHDDLIAMRLGQLVIDHDEFVDKKLDQDLNKRYYVDISGPKKFTSEDIKELPITFKTPIAELQEGEKIKCFVIITKNIGLVHAKWRPVGLVASNELKNGYFVSRVNVGKELKIEENETHYIDSVIIRKNTTHILDHFIATSIAELQIDYSKFKSDAEEIIIAISKIGPGYLIKHGDCSVVPFKYHLDIGELSYNQDGIRDDYDPENPQLPKYKGEEIKCHIIIKKGKRSNIIKWKSPLYDYPENVTGFQIVINNIGMMKTEDIFNEGLKKIRKVASRAAEPITIFHKVRLPDVIPDEIP